MKVKLLTLLFFISVGTFPAFADSEQVVTISGQKVAKTVTQLSFNGDNVILHFSDGTTQTVDMENVTITFTVVDALKALEDADGKEPTQSFDLKGRQLKKAPAKGSYLMKKGDKIVKLINK